MNRTIFSILQVTTLLACVAALAARVAADLSLLTVPASLLRIHPALLILGLVALWRIRSSDAEGSIHSGNGSPKRNNGGSTSDVHYEKRYDGVDGAFILLAFFVFVVIPLHDWIYKKPTLRDAEKTEFLLTMALDRGDYQQAWDLCSPSFQAKLGDASGFQQLLAEGDGPDTKSWQMAPQIEGSKGRFAILRRNDATGLCFKEDIELEEIEGNWCITGFSSAASDLDLDSLFTQEFEGKPAVKSEPEESQEERR